MHARFTRPVRTTSAPVTLCTLAFDPLDRDHGGASYETVAAYWSVQTWRRRGTDWSRVRDCCATRVPTGAVWDIVDRSASGSGRSYIVAPNAADALTLGGYWRMVDEGRYSLRLAHSEYRDKEGKRKRRRPHPLILSGKVDVVGWSKASREYRIVGIGNHVGIPLVDAARMVGHVAPPDAFTTSRPTGHIHPDSEWSASAIAAVYRRLISWWIDQQCGRWQDTIGAAGYQWWRTTIAAKDVLEHDDPAALAQECAAVHGGRVQLFWFGSAGREKPTPDRDSESPRCRPIHLGTPIHKFDIRSMYCSLLHREEFPARYLGRLRCRSVAQLRSAMDSVCAIATVRVRLESPSLPYRDGENGTVYPVGEWWATLTTPELRRAIDRGEVLQVGEVRTYSRGRPFREFADRLLSLRMAAVKSGDLLAGTWCKTVANALGGRLARIRRGWETEEGKPCRQRWGQWVEVVGDSAERVQCRGVAGVRQRLITDGRRVGGLTACYAHLTAHGRVLLAEIIESAGDGNTLWCDTDGVILTDAGAKRVERAGFMKEDAPGFLRREGEIPYFAARTPKHYVSGDTWVLAGARDDFGPVAGCRVACYQSANPVRSGMEPTSESIITRRRVLEIDSIPAAGEPGIDGWLIPPVVSAGAIAQPTDRVPDEIADIDYGD